MTPTDAAHDEAKRVLIFDTTLRDGEQSPGISLNRQEKLEIAHQLARLGVDIIEAGFPITSPGDFESVQAIAREVEGPVICGLARTSTQDISSGRRGGLRSHKGPGGRTYDQLYQEAKERGIRGRSTMSKAELARALKRR